jgi:homoserine kinase
MNEPTDILMRVRQSAVKRILFLPHAIRQMSKPDRMVSTAEIRMVIEHGAVIEDYPEDSRGHSCLILGFADKRALHVVCAPKDDYLAIITAYLPSDQEWEDNYRKRKKS